MKEYDIDLILEGDEELHIKYKELWIIEEGIEKIIETETETKLDFMMIGDIGRGTYKEDGCNTEGYYISMPMDADIKECRIKLTKHIIDNELANIEYSKNKILRLMNRL